MLYYAVLNDGNSTFTRMKPLLLAVSWRSNTHLDTQMHAQDGCAHCCWRCILSSWLRATKATCDRTHEMQLWMWFIRQSLDLTFITEDIHTNLCVRLRHAYTHSISSEAGSMVSSSMVGVQLKSYQSTNKIHITAATTNTTSSCLATTQWCDSQELVWYEYTGTVCSFCTRHCHMCARACVGSLNAPYISLYIMSYGTSSLPPAAPYNSSITLLQTLHTTGWS